MYIKSNEFVLLKSTLLKVILNLLYFKKRINTFICQILKFNKNIFICSLKLIINFENSSNLQIVIYFYIIANCILT